MKRIELSHGLPIRAGKTKALAVLAIGWAMSASGALAVDLGVHEGVTLERQTTTDTIKLRKLAVPNQGFKSGKFKWDPAQNAWVKDGILAADGYYEWMLIHKRSDLSGVELELAGIGPGIQSVSFKSPKGVAYDLAFSESMQGLDIYRYNSGTLPLSQQDFANGKYVLTYTLDTGGTVSRTCYLNSTYPSSVKIAYPANGATAIPLAPVLTWTAISAARYDLSIVNALTSAEVYRVFLDNAIETSLTHSVPAGRLQPGTRYNMNLIAVSPMVNCAQRGVGAAVEFTTAN